MIVKVCGMREADNIRAVSELGVDMLGFVFCTSSPRFVPMISSRAGIIPDYGTVDGPVGRMNSSADTPNTLKRVGVFADDMPQNIVTRVYNYLLDYVQLDGEESRVMIENLRRTLEPDIRPGVKIIKTLYVGCEADLQQVRDYEGVVDLFLLMPRDASVDETAAGPDWQVLSAYDSTTPFLVGGIAPEDAARVAAFHHPQFAGVNLDIRFDEAPGMKDISRIKAFLNKVSS